MKNLISQLHKSKLMGLLFHTLDYCVQSELKDCQTVLDLGCGPSSPLQYCKNIKYSVGVEAFKPYLIQSQKKEIHNKYLNKKIEELKFNKNEFDAVIMIEVLEHLDEKQGNQILKKAEKWAKKKIIVTTPNGFIEQKSLDENPYQRHLSGWDIKSLQRLGFKCNGLAGLKILRKPSEENSMKDDLTVSIKYKPKMLWFSVATLSQLVIYYFPAWAFELFCVKHLD